MALTTADEAVATDQGEAFGANGATSNLDKTIRQGKVAQQAFALLPGGQRPLSQLASSQLVLLQFASVKVAST